MNNSGLNFELYTELLKAVASMSRLYSDSDKPLVHPRFIEKLFVHTTNAVDLSRRDISFDAMLNNRAGVGVKTFVAESFEIEKNEKVAEFTKIASGGSLDSLNHYEKAIRIAELRNKRIISDAHEYDIDIVNSYYHCLVRTAGKAIIHEEPYSLIDINKIYPTDVKGIEVTSFSEDNNGHTYFSDGLSKYQYNKSKNVLYKKFNLQKNNNSSEIELPIYDNIFEKILEWMKLFNTGSILQEIDPPKPLDQPWVDYVILPLYSPRQGYTVMPKSGINQWNAGGRQRSFGEAYIPIPLNIYKEAPNFFPSREHSFKLKLPNNKIISAKVCQDGGKALMSDPNTDLCDWLYSLLDQDRRISDTRFFQKIPYTYDDLRVIGKDSVKLSKSKNKAYDFEIESMPLESYTNFIENNLNSLED
jgi:hypothetical protein